MSSELVWRWLRQGSDPRETRLQKKREEGYSAAVPSISISNSGMQLPRNSVGTRDSIRSVHNLASDPNLLRLAALVRLCSP
jgi:hypothetical protein